MPTIDPQEVQALIDQRRAACAPPSPPAARRAAAPDDLIDALWQMMGSMYGHRWTSAYGAEVDTDRVWAATLAGVTYPQIKHGLRQCVDQGLDWPPTAPEFRRLCIDGSDVAWEHRQQERANAEEAAKRAARALPDKGAEARSDAVARQHLDRLRASFGLPPRPDKPASSKSPATAR